MALYTPFVERSVDKIAAGAQQAQQTKLAQSAYMGDSNAMGQLYGVNPELAERIKKQKAQEKQRQLSQAGDQAKQEQERTEYNREQMETVKERMAKMPYQQAKQFGEQAATELGIDFPPFTEELHEQIVAGYGKAKGELEIGKYNPRDYTTESFSKFVESGDPADLERFATQRSIDIGGVEHSYDPVKGGYFPAKVDGKQVTATTVGESKAEIAKTVQAAKDAQKLSTESFTALRKARKSLVNYDEALASLDAGAGTGAIESRMPTIKAASLALKNAQNRMGLDVIGDVTFGALSKGELDLALETALPTGMDEKELRKWIVDKKRATQIYADHLEDATIFLSEPGNTIADWVKQNKGGKLGRETGKVTKDNVGKMSLEDLIKYRKEQSEK